jgi:D-beta-D-heptose 7-phosphate kinase/D-beta-D-heptose 1-phosphate adenosyltransferase
MTPIDRLIAADRETSKRLCILGDSVTDDWIHGDLQPSQDGCMKFVERRSLSTPGGAAGAARQLCRWNCEADLISLVKTPENEAWNQVNMEYAHYSRRMPLKRRYIDSQDRIVFRHDLDNGYGADANLMAEHRRLSLLALREGGFDALLISDYAKGFLDEATIREAVKIANERQIPVVADAKRKPAVYGMSILKLNEDYAVSHRVSNDLCIGDAVMTLGPRRPSVKSKSEIYYPLSEDWEKPRHSPCINHVGAGDCFSAVLTLALAHGLSLEDAAQIAHSAGRVYVQSPHGRPPYPHEIRRDLDPVGGKVLTCSGLPALRQSILGRIVFTCGTFRAIHAGHAAMLQWAKQQGDVLVVGINSDASVRRIKAGGYCLPAAERASLIASMACVDWLVVFEEDDPCATLEALGADVMVKGDEYRLCTIPGHSLVKEVRFAPMVEASRPARLIPA